MQIDSLIASGTGVSALLRGVGADSSGLGSLFSGGLGGAAAGDQTASSFGPAATLSVGGLTGADALSAPVNAIIGAAYGARSPAAPRSPKLIAREKETIKQAQVLIGGGELDAARKLLADHLAQNPPSGAITLLQGEAEQAAGDYAKAESYFRKAAAIDPSLNAEVDAENMRALQKGADATMARANRLLNDPSTRGGGVRLLETYLKKNPKDVEARVAVANAYLAARNSIKGLFHYSQAMSAANKTQLQNLEERFTELVEKSPQDAFARNLLGKAQARLGKLDEALETLHAASDLADGAFAYRSDEADVLVQLGKEALKRGDLTGAFSQIEQALVLNPTSGAGKLARGEAFAARAEKRLQQGDLKRAIQDFDKAARDARGGDAADLRERIARGVYSVGRRLEGERVASGDDIGDEIVAFQTAYELDPQNETYKRKLADTRYALGQQYLADEEYADAAASFQRAYDLYNNNSTYKAAAIDAYRRDGDEKLADYRHDGAIAAYRRAYLLDSGDTTSKSKLGNAYNTAGLYYRDLNERSRARDYFAEAIQLFPDNTEYRSNYDSVAP